MFWILFSIVTSDCFIFLFNDHEVIASVKEYDNYFHSENFIKRLDKILTENQISLSNLKKIYFILDTNDQTSNRVSVSFVTAMSILSQKVRIFFIESSKFQKGKLKNCLSVISFGKKIKKYWLNYYENNQLLYRKKVFSFEDINRLNKKNFQVIYNFENIDFVENFFFLSEDFKEFKG